METIEELLEDTGKIILLDSSIREQDDIRDGFNICRRIYEAERFQHLDNADLERGIREMTFLTEMFFHPTVFTIPKVSGEIEQIVKIIGDKLKYLNKKREDKSHASLEQEELLEELQQKTYNAFRAAKNKELERWQTQLETRVDKKQVTPLAEMIILIDDKIGLKKDAAFLYGDHDKDMSRESNTGEHLVATLYYLSMFSKRTPVLLTGDTDFIRLLGVIPRLLGSPDFLPYNLQFRNAIKQNLPILYFKGKDKGYTEIALKDLDYSNPFRINNINLSENDTTRAHILNLWQDFASFTSVASRSSA